MGKWILPKAFRAKLWRSGCVFSWGFLAPNFACGNHTGLVILCGVGKWLVREDPLQPATAIVVLSGNIPTRALEAAALYHEGYAKEIWLTHPDVHADALKELGITYPSGSLVQHTGTAQGGRSGKGHSRLGYTRS